MSVKNWFYRFDKIINRIPILIAIRKGLTYMIPLLLLGSFALLINSLPIPFYQSFMAQSLGEDWGLLLTVIHDSTFGMMSLFMVICISYSYANEIGLKKNTSPIITASVSLASYLAISEISIENFHISSFGASGIFMAIVVSASSSVLFLKFSSLNAFKLKAYTNGADAVFKQALSSIFPAAVTVGIFAAINVTLSNVFHIASIQEFLSTYFSTLFTRIESPFLSGLLFVILIHLFWFFGMHGSNILEPVTQAVFQPGVEVNQRLIEAGLTPDIVFTKTFIDSFILMGGCGTAICLVTAILLAGKYKNQRELAKLSALPLLFNINELVVFGLPIVLNPIFLVPFLCVPVLLTFTAFFAVYYGFVPYTIHAVEWTTPILLSGYMATQSISGSILQLFNFVLGTACYIPFVRLSEMASQEQIKLNLKKVYSVYKENEERGYPPALLSRHDEIGNLSRFLASDLADDLKNENLKLYYQPQTDYNGKIFGVEALLRWNHPVYGYIYPPLIIALAEESSIIDNLGRWIFNKALEDLGKLRNAGYSEISLSVNVSAVQLENETLISWLKNKIEMNQLPFHSVKIEITEQIALAGSHKIMDQIDSIKQLGIKLAMDDFGMGHSSLKYLKEYEFDTIKLDGSLIREVVSNSNCRNIISSIVYLCNSLDCSIIAEYVEAEDQKNILYQLGCEKYQGYLYSEPLPYEALVQYLISNTGKKR
ncbi:EAL domain-containing protein [Anoxybacterium hadale]|uniref:EAL domain-containing protein n=1 Tax=Anoxybacterium hadale TaxID=3408580 RepID=UPI003AFF8625